MASDIDHILSPKPLNTLQYKTPVKCIIWKGEKKYDTITLHIYPFDTLDTLKRLVYYHYKQDDFLPRFTFMGIPSVEGTPTKDTTYLAIDYLWYRLGENDVKDTFKLANPVNYAIDERFVTRDGSFSNPNYEMRGRSTVEDIFIKHGNTIPTFHVFPLVFLLRGYARKKPTTEEWNRKFAAYFIDIPVSASYTPTADDIQFGAVIKRFIENRDTILKHLNDLIERQVQFPRMRLTGIEQLILIWKKPIEGYEGCASTFYNIPVTKTRPYIRLYPSEGSPITKLHVKGVLPIPTLDDPRLLEIWSKETSFTPGIDCCTIKYVHRPAIGILQSIYGTIRLLNDGTITLALQPPKQIRRLDPEIDFRDFTGIIGEIFTGLPQEVNTFNIKELTLTLSLNLPVKSAKFNRERLKKRLPYFSYFFKEIVSLPGSFMTLRYKAISQYASEDEVFTFITQLSSEQGKDGTFSIPQLLGSIQDEFQFTMKEATQVFRKWQEKREQFMAQLPEDGEFTETYNSGIDIQIEYQHPLYLFHVSRINNFESYIRIYTLLSLLFIEDDGYFKGESVSPEVFADLEEKMEKHVLKNERKDEFELEGEESEAEEEEEAEAEAEEPVNPENDDEDDDLAAHFAARARFGLTASTIKQDVPAQPAPKKAVAVVAAPAVAAPVAAEPAPVKLAKLQDAEQHLVNPKSWFINKLKEIDPDLFSFKPGKGKASDGYSTQCQSVDDRQPVILTRDQYNRMRDVYEDDHIFWVVYPLDKDADPVQPLGTEETFTIMRYGSSQHNMNYMFCPEYFCISDEIMIRKADFESNQDREGKPKPPNTCPFCRGRLIASKAGTAIRGNTVVQRKAKGDTVHSHIGFLKTTHHPSALSLPCCFKKQSTLRIGSPEFKHLRQFMQEKEVKQLMDAIANEEEEEEEEEEDEDLEQKHEDVPKAAKAAKAEKPVEFDQDDYSELVFRAKDAIEYSVLFEKIHEEYILESNKKPMPGIFAIVPPYFDAFFTQNSTTQMITRDHIKLKLKPNARGFLRIGTENTPYESLLGVIAPIINTNTIKEVKKRILDKVVPRIFINSHFGNLVLEFYNPEDKSSMPSTNQELKLWASKNLGISLNSVNMYELIRIYNSYNRFVNFINNPTQRKELRHIQPLLAEPGLFSINGIQLLIMEDNDGEITIKCPTFGVAMRHRHNDFVFISKTKKEIASTGYAYNLYELYIHTSNTPGRGGHVPVHDTILLWNAASRKIWPPVVTAHIDQYIDECQSRYTSIYTLDSSVNASAIIPLSYAYDAAKYRFNGIVKDTYNHIVAVTYKLDTESNVLVAVPVIDDGAIAIASGQTVKHIYLNWEDYKVAPVDDFIYYYKTYVDVWFSLYPGYAIAHLVKKRGSDDIIAVQLKNGIYVPVGGINDQVAFDGYVADLTLDTVEIEEFQWDIDKRIDGHLNRNQSNWNAMLDDTTVEKRCGVDDTIQKKSSYVEFEELYQQFRYMVSSYIVQTADVKRNIEKIIFNSDLPQYEKRKRLYIYLGSTLLSWFYLDSEWEASLSFLRKDCRVIDTEEGCTGTCHWKADEGRCLLHVKDRISLDDSTEHMVNTAELFTKRVVDELAYFPNRRKQLMRKGEISKVSKIIKPIHDGDQYIIPESSVSWVNLLRLEWIKEKSEEPRYYEEMSREGEHGITKTAMPISLLRILGDSTPFSFYIPPNQDPAKPFISLAGILKVELEELKLTEDSTEFTDDNFIHYVHLKRKPIGLIDLRKDTIKFYSPFNKVFTEVLIFIHNGTNIGILIKEDGNEYININALPESILPFWKKPQYVTLKKKQVFKEPALPIAYPAQIIEPEPLPLVAQEVEKPKKLVRQRDIFAKRKPAKVETEIEEIVVKPLNKLALPAAIAEKQKRQRDIFAKRKPVAASAAAEEPAAEPVSSTVVAADAAPVAAEPVSSTVAAKPAVKKSRDIFAKRTSAVAAPAASVVPASSTVASEPAAVAAKPAEPASSTVAAVPAASVKKSRDIFAKRTSAVASSTVPPAAVASSTVASSTVAASTVAAVPAAVGDEPASAAAPKSKSRLIKMGSTAASANTLRKG